MGLMHMSMSAHREVQLHHRDKHEDGRNSEFVLFNDEWLRWRMYDILGYKCTNAIEAYCAALS